MAADDNMKHVDQLVIFELIHEGSIDTRDV